MARYRHKVFIEKLDWQLAVEHDIELDQFDGPDTLYVIALNDRGQVTGVARLLPTTGAYLLKEVFPQLLDGVQVPCSETIWELSRFAAVDFDAARTSPMSQFSSPVAVELLQACIDVAHSKGADALITVSPIGVERLLRRAGFKAHRAAAPKTINGDDLVACVLDCRGQ
ncbi:MAG: N-acylhomoserine lactone synthase [Burkholderiales bacterium]|nr:N-acylhomoserine lactone synthase [Burkholderiales bacterium]